MEGCAMIDISAATLCWRSDDVWIEAGDAGPQPHASAQPIGSLEQAMAAGWMAVTDGLPVADVHAALLGLDRYREAYHEP
jgi:hypothetical protein